MQHISRCAARLAEIGKDNKLKKTEDGNEDFTDLWHHFLDYDKPSISSPKMLARKMAALAREIRNMIINAFEDEDKGGNLHEQIEGLREVLIHNLKPDEFADMYARTINA